MTTYDVIVIGGGPAGSTFSSLLKKYSPERKVLLVEKTPFPRHHVGESLLAGASPVLHEMGAYDRISRHGFVEKLGASYVWGRDRRPWGFEFQNLVAEFTRQGRPLPDMYTKGWHVRRGEYDHLLLQTAAEHGVEVLMPAQAVDVLYEDGSERVCGLKIRHGEETKSVKATWVVDASGQDGFLARKFGLRQFDDRMNNFAIWAYWKGAKWESRYLGHPNLARIFIATTPRGWIWYIPVSQDVMSVGLVTNKDVLRAHESHERLYHEELNACAEIDGLLNGAEIVRISDDQERDICVIRDWSYDSLKMAGPGWALVGDAAGFVDPILSSGVMLAHELGQKAAYTMNSVLGATSDEQVGRYWDYYERTYRTYLKAYRDMAAYWYSNNFSMESWWWEARRGISSGGDAQLSDAQSFMRLASGYANRAELLSLFGSYPVHEAQSLVNGLFGAVDPKSAAAELNGHIVRLAPHAQKAEGLYYHRGFVRSTVRVLNSESGQYLDLHPGEDVLLDLLGEGRRHDEMDAVVSSIRATYPGIPIRGGAEIVSQLNDIGVIAQGQA